MDDDEMPAARTEGEPVREVLDALRAWLLAEDGYERGGVPEPAGADRGQAAPAVRVRVAR